MKIVKKILISAVILTAASVIKINSSIDSPADCISAFNIVGCGIRGENNLQSTLNKAYECAFFGADDEVIQVSGTENEKYRN